MWKCIFIEFYCGSYGVNIVVVFLNVIWVGIIYNYKIGILLCMINLALECLVYNSKGEGMYFY